MTLKLPSLRVTFRNVDPNDVAFEKGAKYNEDAFYLSELATLSEPYIQRCPWSGGLGLPCNTIQ